MYTIKESISTYIASFLASGSGILEHLSISLYAFASFMCNHVLLEKNTRYHYGPLHFKSMVVLLSSPLHTSKLWNIYLNHRPAIRFLLLLFQHSV